MKWFIAALKRITASQISDYSPLHVITGLDLAAAFPPLDNEFWVYFSFCLRRPTFRTNSMTADAGLDSHDLWWEDASLTPPRFIVLRRGNGRNNQMRVCGTGRRRLQVNSFYLGLMFRWSSSYWAQPFCSPLGGAAEYARRIKDGCRRLPNFPAASSGLSETISADEPKRAVLCSPHTGLRVTQRLRFAALIIVGCDL